LEPVITGMETPPRKVICISDWRLGVRPYDLKRVLVKEATQAGEPARVTARLEPGSLWLEAHTKRASHAFRNAVDKINRKEPANQVK